MSRKTSAPQQPTAPTTLAAADPTPENTAVAVPPAAPPTALPRSTEDRPLTVYDVVIHPTQRAYYLAASVCSTDALDAVGDAVRDMREMSSPHRLGAVEPYIVMSVVPVVKLGVEKRDIQAQD